MRTKYRNVEVSFYRLNLVENSFDERYARHYPLQSIGRENQLALRTKSALIVGVGGLGTVSSELLASIGIGHLRIVDYDVIELSNLPRQKLYSEEDIGKAKVDVAELVLRKRNPMIGVDALTTRVDALSAASLLDGMDVVVDGLDRFSSRKILHREAYKLKIPFVFTGAIGETANVMTFNFKNDSPCLECVLGNVNDDPNMRCDIQGVNPVILQIAASIQVSEVINILLDKKPTLQGKMMIIDQENLDFETVTLRKRKDCRVCGTQDLGDLDGGEPGDVTKGHREITGYGQVLITSLCGRDTFIIDPSWKMEKSFEEIKEKINQNFSTKASGNNYITFLMEDVNISLMESGISTIRGAKKSNVALGLLRKVLDTIS